MAHIRIDAPDGFVYHRKGTTNKYARTEFIGEGGTIDDYELVTEAEYQAFLAEQEKAEERAV